MTGLSRSIAAAAGACALLDRALRWGLRGPVHFYRAAISPWLPPACRFYPTCSEYALEALRVHPTPRALFLIVRRLGRCHPWGGCGFDPVPTPHASPPDPIREDASPDAAPPAPPAPPPAD